MLRKIIEIITIICNPGYWTMNDQYSPEWDFTLNVLMTSEKFKANNDFHAKLGKYNIWIVNHPYASFTCNEFHGRPSRITIMRAYKRYKSDTTDIKKEKSLPELNIE